MMKAPQHPQEPQRLQALRDMQLLDTPLQKRFERITRMIQRTMNVPISVFNLIDEDRQHYKSVQGLNVTDAPLDPAFCTHAILEDDMLLVPDAKKDQRFHDNPFVTGELLDIGFYAGCPVRAANGLPIGTLCAIDTKPRDMSADQLDALRDLAAMLETELKLASLSRSQASLIEELSQANRLAMIDPLTRLWNRAGLHELLQREWAEALRAKKQVTLVICDIDHFKSINDTRGHAGGDDVLRGVAKKLLDTLRGEDIVGRWGGEEFLLVLTDCQQGKVDATLERIRAAIAAEPFDADGAPQPVTMSFGVATVIPSEGGECMESLIKRADAALYRAKRDGRNRVVIDSARAA